MTDPRKPLRVIHSRAPIRICDNGGWTDTWFARHGKIFNIAVSPTVEIQLSIFADDGNSPRYTIDARNYNQRYSIDQPNGNYGRHPLIEAVLDFMPAPQGQSLELSIACDAPPGCSTGTSASVAVAVIGAMDWLTPGRLTTHELGAAAHRVETDFLHQECGIQDQIAAAFGGINFIDMDDYPHARIDRIELPAEVERELEARLALIYVGSAHRSSDVHEMVIRQLQDAGPDAPQLERLRAAAAKSRDALYAGDLPAFGRSMIENTKAQRSLHPRLIGAAHQEIIDIAREYGALGWKVNGAGGEGGSVTLLTGPNRDARVSMLETIAATNLSYRNIPIRLDHSGLCVWESATT